MRIGRRVVVTGLGMVTPLGNDVAANWDALLAGRSGIGPITPFDAGGLPVRDGGPTKPRRTWAVALPLLVWLATRQADRPHAGEYGRLSRL